MCFPEDSGELERLFLSQWVGAQFDRHLVVSGPCFDIRDAVRKSVRRNGGSQLGAEKAYQVQRQHQNTGSHTLNSEYSFVFADAPASAGISNRAITRS